MAQAGSVYRFRNVKGGIYLDESNKDQGTVHGWDSRPDNDNQKWELEDAGNGGFRIKNVGHGRYLSVSGPHDNAAVKTSGDPTVWTFKSQGRGDAIYIQDTDFVVDLDQGRDENGTRVSVWRYTGAHQQLWDLEEVGGGYRGGQPSGQPSGQPYAQPQQPQQQQYQGPIQPGTYRAHNIFTNAALDLAGGSPNDGTPIVAWSAGTGTNQTWIFESGTNGYRIKNGASGSYLGYGALNQGELISGRSQPVEWTVTQADKGYQIHPAQNQELVLDLAEGKREDGAKICLWANNNAAGNNDNQKWNFAPA